MRLPVPIDKGLLLSLAVVLSALQPTLLDAATQTPSSKQLTFSLGGRLKLDSIYSNRASTGAQQTRFSDLGFSPAAIPLDNDNTLESYKADLRASRIWTTWHLPLAGSDLAGYLEVDLLASKNKAGGGTRPSGLPRLRHYYLTYRGLTLGQTQTTFFNVSSFPEINDNNGPLGSLTLRQRQLRYSHKFKWLEAALAVEDSETTLTTASGNRVRTDTERYPDLVGRLTFSGDWGNWSLAALMRQLVSRDGGVTDEQWGAAVNLAGRLRVAERDNLRFSFTYGNASGRYMSSGVFSDGLIDSNSKIRLTPVIAGNLAYQHWWTRTLRSNLVLGAALADNPASPTIAQQNRRFISSHLNVMWSPRPIMTVGLEWLYGHRQREDNSEGELHRLLLTATWNF